MNSAHWVALLLSSKTHTYPIEYIHIYLRRERNTMLQGSISIDRNLQAQRWTSALRLSRPYISSSFVWGNQSGTMWRHSYRWGEIVLKTFCTVNLTTSLRRTLSPVCQQNAKRCNKCRKQLENHSSATKTEFRCSLGLLRRRQFRRFQSKRAKRFPGCTSRKVGCVDRPARA